MGKLKVGDTAPIFSLLNQAQDEINIKSMRGKTIILYFYPKASTPGCTTQACGIRDSKKIFDKKGVVVFGISPDDPKKLLKFIEKEDLNFDLLSDPDHIIAEKYGVWGLKKFMGKEYMGIIRSTFIIGSDGKIKAILDEVKTKTHHEDVLMFLA